MSVSPLRADPGAEVLGSLTAARTSVATGARIGAASVSSMVLAEAVVELAALESQVAAWRLDLGLEAHARQLAAGDHDPSTASWLAKLTGETREILAGGLRTAALLQTRYHHTRQALSEGSIRLEQAKVIIRAAESAPSHVSDEDRAAAEESLVAAASGAGTRTGRPLGAKRLRQQARRMFECVSKRVADEHEADLLDQEERRARAETFFSLHDDGDGTYSGRFRVPELHGRLLEMVLDTLTAPRRSRRPGASAGEERDPTATTTNLSEIRGQAFCELLEHLPDLTGTPHHRHPRRREPAGAGESASYSQPGADQASADDEPVFDEPDAGCCSDAHSFSGTNIISLGIVLDYEHLLDGLGAARLDAGVAIAVREARRLACEAGILPAVFGGKSQPLELGRTRRLHGPGQRRMLSLIYSTCAALDCDRPFAWCEIHHPVWWSRGGRTDLDNGLPLCGWHHRHAHDPRFDLRQHLDGTWRFHLRR